MATTSGSRTAVSSGSRTSPSGLKRKLTVADDAIYLEGDGRSAKRISPFLNTPIQKKEAKRRILRLSMRKMRDIECPESFLRRSVLINNLARSLQDDLKDDKLWSRWDWVSDVETLPYRGHVPDAAGSRTLPAPCAQQASSSASPRYPGQHGAGSGHWASAGAHAHWLNADDVDMSASERERVCREMALSHDRLAEAVDSMTSYDGDYASPLSSTSDKRNGKDSLADADRSRTGYVTSGDDPTTASRGCGGDGLLTFDGAVSYAAPPSAFRSGTILDDKSPLPCAGYRTKADAVPSLDIRHLDTYPAADYSCTLVPSTSLSQPVHIGDVGVQVQDSTPRYPDGQLAKISGYEKAGAKDSTWTMPCVDYPEDVGTTYLDMTSNSVCRVRNDTSLLESMESSIPSLQTAMHSTTATNDVTSHVTHSGQPLSSTPASSTSSSSSGHQMKLGFSAADTMSSALDGIVSGNQWNSTTSDDVINSSVAASFSLGTTVSCSAEADRPEYATSSEFMDPDKFSSQSLRDFDIIYNNLVSVLIGGN